MHDVPTHMNKKGIFIRSLDMHAFTFPHNILCLRSFERTYKQCTHTLIIHPHHCFAFPSNCNRHNMIFFRFSDRNSPIPSTSCTSTVLCPTSAEYSFGWHSFADPLQHYDDSHYQIGTLSSGQPFNVYDIAMY